MLTKEELRGFGQMFSTPDVLAQGVFSVGLAVRDAALLAAAGWPAARTEALRGLLGRLQTEHNAYAAKAGVKKATRAELLEQMFQAKRWKGIAVAIGQNALDDNPAERAKLLEQTMPVRGDAARRSAGCCRSRRRTPRRSGPRERATRSSPRAGPWRSTSRTRWGASW